MQVDETNLAECASFQTFVECFNFGKKQKEMKFLDYIVYNNEKTGKAFGRAALVDDINCPMFMKFAGSNVCRRVIYFKYANIVNLDDFSREVHSIVDYKTMCAEYYNNKRESFTDISSLKLVESLCDLQIQSVLKNKVLQRLEIN